MGPIKQYWKFAIISICGLLVVYYIFRPTYEIRVYKLGFYPYTYLTQMIYSGFISRELLYIYGNYQNETYPDTDYIVFNDFSGFDSISNIIADCDSNQNIIIYSISGPTVYKNPTGSKKIISRQVENRQYIKMRENQIGRHIVAE